MLYLRKEQSIGLEIQQLIVCLPMEIHYVGFTGALAAITASVIEQIEFEPIDDNML